MCSAVGRAVDCLAARDFSCADKALKATLAVGGSQEPRTRCHAASQSSWGWTHASWSHASEPLPLAVATNNDTGYLDPQAFDTLEKGLNVTSYTKPPREEFRRLAEQLVVGLHGLAGLPAPGTASA